MNRKKEMTLPNHGIAAGDGTGEGELFLRNHITYIVERAWTVILVFILSIIGNGELLDLVISFLKREKLDENMQMHLLWLLGAIALLLVLVGWYLNRWYRTTLTVRDGTITYRQKTLTRKSNTMSVKQVSNVNVEQNIFEMIFGTCKMRLDTDSLSTANETDVEMILKKKRAEEVKKCILAMKEGVDIQEAEGDMDVEEYDILYHFGETMANGLLSITVSQLVAAVVFLVSFVATLGITLNDVAKGDYDHVFAGLGLLVMEFFTAYSFVWAILKKILQDFRFRARRKDDQIYVSCGLWKRKSYMVPVNKINAVKIEYPVLARIFGRGYLRVLNVGGEGEEADGMKLLLLGSYDDLRRRMEILLPEFQLPDLRERTRVPRQWMYIRMLASLAAGAVGGVAVYLGLRIGLGSEKGFWQDYGKIIPGICLGIGAAVMFLWLLCSYLRYKTCGIGFQPGELLLVQGTFRKEVSLIPYGRIQYICYERGPMEQFLGLQHGHVSLLASAASRCRRMGSFRVEDFQVLEEKLRETY